MGLLSLTACNSDDNPEGKETFTPIGLTSIQDETAQIINLPYSGGNFSMYIILPSKKNDINDFIGNLTYEYINQTIGYLNQERNNKSDVILSLPKFIISSNIRLNDILTNMGMDNIFYNSLPLIFDNPNFILSKVNSSSKMSVDENGTTIATVTETNIGDIVATPTYNMKIDRPFLFFICENSTNTTLFLGKIGQL